MRRGQRAGWICLWSGFLLLVALPAHGSDVRNPLVPSDKAVLQGWLNRLHHVSDDLRAANWKHAQDSIRLLLSEMRQRLEGGPAAGSLLALASLYRALAEAGLGDERNASWDFHIAQALYPNYRRVDLSEFGAVGKILDAHRVDTSQEPSGEAGEEEVAESDLHRVVAPKRIHAPMPSFPFAKANACLASQVVVAMIIGRDGELRDPSLDVPVDAIFGYAAMDELREWRFRPAKLRGRPVTVVYKVTVNYKPGKCESR